MRGRSDAQRRTVRPRDGSPPSLARARATLASRAVARGVRATMADVHRFVFRLACALWFALGCALGRASASLGRRATTRKDANETSATASRARRAARARSETTTGTASAAPMDLGESASAAGGGEADGEARDGEEAESAFAGMDDEMEDAFVDESETRGDGDDGEGASERFGSAPATFASKENGTAKTGGDVAAETSRGDESGSAAEDESDSAETKEKMYFVAEQVSEATSALNAADDERAKARAEANKIEWERRAEELAKQREEARRLKQAARKERRMMERSQTFRQEAEDRAKEADSLNEYRVSAQTALKSEGLYFIAENGDLATLLLRLGTHEDGKNIETSYKKALLKFHPDRSAARGGTLEDNARCEETFKLLQACRKVWENMGKPNKAFTRAQPSMTRQWTRATSSSTQTYSTSPPNNNAAYESYQAGRRSAEAEARDNQSEVNAAFVQKAKQEATEAENRMRTEAARRWRELQRMQREKSQRESKAETTRVDSLQKAREREELRKKLEEIKRTSASFPMSENVSPASERTNLSPGVSRTLSGTRVHVNVKPTVSPGIDAYDAVSSQSARATSPRSPQTKEQTLHRL